MRFWVLMAAALAIPPGCGAAPRVVLGFGEAEKLILHAEPVRLPPEVERLGLRGTVVVRLDVAEDGHVVHAVLVSGHPLLAGPALRAAAQYRFRPLMVQGHPVRWRGLLRIPVPTPARRQDPRVAELAGPHASRPPQT